MTVEEKVGKFRALRGRALELGLITASMANATSVAEYDRGYSRLCDLLELVGERLDLFDMEERGFVQISPDTWKRAG